MTLPRRQRQVLILIAAGPKCPTYREIGDALGIASTNGVSEHVRALIKKGLLTSVRGRARSLNLTAEGWAILGQDIRGLTGEITPEQMRTLMEIRRAGSQLLALGMSPNLAAQRAMLAVLSALEETCTHPTPAQPQPGHLPSESPCDAL